jgi:hypothetical protein
VYNITLNKGMRVLRINEKLDRVTRRAAKASLGIIAAGGFMPAAVQAKFNTNDIRQANSAPAYQPRSGSSIESDTPSSLKTDLNRMLGRLANTVLTNHEIQSKGAMEAQRQGKNQIYTATINTSDEFLPRPNSNDRGEYQVSIVAPSERDGNIDLNKIESFTISEGLSNRHGLFAYSILNGNTSVNGGELVYQTHIAQGDNKVLSYSSSIEAANDNDELTPYLIEQYGKMGDLMLRAAETSTPTHDMPAKYLPATYATGVN